jgi:hypothetical protein
MALVPIFGHGFDNLATADRPIVFVPRVGAGTNYNVQAAGGRGGGRYAQITNTNSQLPVPVPTSVDTYAFGTGAMHVSIFSGWSTLSLYDNATCQVCVVVRADRRLEVRRGGQGGALLAGPGTAVMSNAIWQHVAVWVKVHGSAGRVVVKVNGIVDLDTGAGGVNTQASANAYGTQVIFGFDNGGFNGCDLRFDDPWVATAAGTLAGDGYGDLNFEAKVPNGAGNSTQFTPSTGANWQNVDDIPQNGDTDYNYSNTVGQKDTFTATDLVATTGSVSFIMLETFDRKEDAGSANFRHVLRMGAAESEGADFAPVQDANYAHHRACFDTKPGGGAIALADANAMEIGYKYQS